MGVVNRSIYNIDFNDTDYIRAIAKYNKYATLPSFNNKTCAELPKIIAGLKIAGLNSLNLEVNSWNSDTLRDVFPKIQVPEGGLAVLTKKSSSLQDDFSQMVDEVSGRIKTLRSPLEVYFYPLELNTSASHPKLSQEDAIKLVQCLSLRDSDISSAIHVPSANTIIFMDKRLSFRLTYGDNPSFDETSLKLDIDDGFTVREPGAGNTDEMLKAVLNVLAELQSNFSKWRDNHYQGVLIPDSLGVKVDNANKPVLGKNAGMFNAGLKTPSKAEHNDSYVPGAKLN